MGKIGLPLAVNFARNGASVTGLDNQVEVVDKINKGIEPFPGEKYLSHYLEKCITNSSLVATTNIKESLVNANVIVVCIPLIIDSKGAPEFKSFDRLVNEIGKNVSVGTLICFETTLPVGTTRSRFTPAIEAASGLKIGKDFFVVFSPERVLTGRLFEDLRRYPKLVGGVTDECTSRGVTFYESVLNFDSRYDLEKANGVWAMKNCDSAEFAKVAETTYRDVNIGLANEFAVFAARRNIDIKEVIRASNSQPFSHIHSPGISVGGHCIPVYPKFYMWENEDSQIVKAARERNLDMPLRAIRQIKQEIGDLKDLRIGILGITYRSGVKETAFSGSFDLLRNLVSEGATVMGMDPFYSAKEIISFGFNSQVNLADLDGVIIHTDHKEFEEIDFNSLHRLKFLYDGRRSHAKWRDTENFKYLTF